MVNFQLREFDIMTDEKLVKMKIKRDPSCNWCDCNKKTLLHSFWDCEIVKNIWIKLIKLLSDSLTCTLIIGTQLVFLHDIEAGRLTIITFVGPGF